MKINIIYTENNISNLSNTYILLADDSIGNLNYSNYDNINDIQELEENIKKKINSYKFKTLHNRCYLPLGSSLLIKYKLKKYIFSPIMWVKQDISNTNNIYTSFYSALLLLYKYSILNNDLEDKYIYVKPSSPIRMKQINKAYKDFNNNIEKKTKKQFIEEIDFKEDDTIFFNEVNIDEQPPFLQNNEFRELSFT
jgi:hypothetical protein